MSLTHVMDDVDYDRLNVNENEALAQHPPWMTECHYVYHLDRGENGQLAFHRDTDGEPLCSPRPLRLLSMQPMVVKPSRMRILTGCDVPSDLYPHLLTEAILQRSLQTVSHLVSTWPLAELHVRDLLPQEDLDKFQQLADPCEGAKPAGMSLCEAVMVGLLNLKPVSRLKLISFTGFHTDRKVGRELARLPILWLHPSKRCTEYVCTLLRHNLGITMDDVDRYINRINCIYSNVDNYVTHDQTFGPITVVLDCQVTLDDVPIGLALQFATPFRFRCQRVWIEDGSEMSVPLSALSTVLDPRHITHLELEIADLCLEDNGWAELREGLPLLGELQALGLPTALHVDHLQHAADVLTQLGGILAKLSRLRRLDLASCCLREGLGHLLDGLGEKVGGLEYLGLRDCRLVEHDLSALLRWPGVSTIRELILSRNNLQTCTHLVVELLGKMAASVVCFSVSYTSLSPPDVQRVVQECRQCPALKILAVQSFTPPQAAELKALIESCVEVPALQRCIIFPESYAFPGRQIRQRAANRASIGLLCLELLMELGRPDLQLQ